MFYLFSLLRLLPRLQVHLFLPLILLLNLLPFLTQTERVAARPVSSSSHRLWLSSFSSLLRGDQNQTMPPSVASQFPSSSGRRVEPRRRRLFPAASIPRISSIPALYLPRRVVATQHTARHHQKSSTTTTPSLLTRERIRNVVVVYLLLLLLLLSVEEEKDTTKEEGRSLLLVASSSSSSFDDDDKNDDDDDDDTKRPRPLLLLLFVWFLAFRNNTRLS